MVIQLDDKVVQVCADAEHESSGRDDELDARLDEVVTAINAHQEYFKSECERLADADAAAAEVSARLGSRCDKAQVAQVELGAAALGDKGCARLSQARKRG